MKKLMKIVAVSLVLCMCFMLSSCFLAKGVYKVSQVKVNVGNTQTTYDVGDTILGMITITEDFAVLELKGDDVCEFTFDKVTKVGTWDMDDGKIEVEIDGRETVFVKDGKTLTFNTSYGGMSLDIILVKQ